MERWRREYNQIRPHSSLGYKPPTPEAVLPIDGNTSLLLFGSAPLHLTTMAGRLTQQVVQTSGADHFNHKIFISQEVDCT